MGVRGSPLLFQQQVDWTRSQIPGSPSRSALHRPPSRAHGQGRATERVHVGGRLSGPTQEHSHSRGCGRERGGGWGRTDRRRLGLPQQGSACMPLLSPAPAAESACLGGLAATTLHVHPYPLHPHVCPPAAASGRLSFGAGSREGRQSNTLGRTLSDLSLHPQSPRAQRIHPLPWPGPPVPPRLLGVGCPQPPNTRTSTQNREAVRSLGAERCAPAGVCGPKDQPGPSAASALQALEGASQPPDQRAPQKRPWASQRSPAPCLICITIC